MRSFLLSAALLGGAQAIEVPDVLSSAENLKQVQNICWISSQVYINGQKSTTQSNLLHSIMDMYMGLWADGQNGRPFLKNNRVACQEKDHVFAMQAQAFKNEDGTYLYHINFDVFALKLGDLKYVSLWHNYGFGTADNEKDLEQGLETTVYQVLNTLLEEDWK